MDATRAADRRWPHTSLLNADGSALQAGQLGSGEYRVFHYPYVTTPCFLIRLPHAADEPVTLSSQAGGAYHWPGGVGPDHAMVAFSAICSHKMTHPSRPVSHLNVRRAGSGGADEAAPSPLDDSALVIKCCSEYSLYDPAVGARVLSGPAPQPLAGIELEIEDSGQIIATGCFGGTLFEPFLDQFGFRLAIEHRVTDPATVCGPTATAWLPEQWSDQQIHC